MKLAIFLISSSLFAQTKLSNPAIILPPANRTTGSSLEMQDSTSKFFVGLLTPTTLPVTVISAATNANPMVLTTATAMTIQTGSVIVIEGATGTGCSIMNGPQTVSSVTGTSVTLGLNGTGCTYTASSASAATSYWAMPGADAAGCWQSNGASVLSIGSCGGITFVNTSPSGVCTNTPPMQYNYTNGSLWACEALTWTQINAGSSLPVSDATVITYNDADNTKKMRFDDSIITTGNTRVLQVQDANYQIAGTNITNTFTGNQIFNGSVLILEGGSGIAFDIPLPGSGSIALEIPSAGATTYAFTFPPNGGSSNYVLYTNGSGTTNWTSVTSLLPLPLSLSYGGGGATIFGEATTTTNGIGLEGDSTAPSGYGGFFTASGSGSSFGVYSTATAAGGQAGYFYNGSSTSGTVAALKAQSDVGGSGLGPALELDGTVIGSIFPTASNVYFIGNGANYYAEVFAASYSIIGSPLSSCFTCAWFIYTPTVTGLTGITSDSKYNCAGKLCYVHIEVTGTGGGGFPTFTLPAAAINNFTALAGGLMVSGSYQQSMCLTQASSTVLTAQFSSASGLTNTYFCEGVYEAS